MSGSRRGFRIPTLGMMLGAFVLVVETAALAGLVQIDATLSWRDLLCALAVYVVLLGCLDLLLQLPLPGGGWRIVLRAVLLVPLAFGATVLLQVPMPFTYLVVAAIWALLQIGLAGLWALRYRGRWWTLLPSAALSAWVLVFMSPAPPKAPAPPLAITPARGPSIAVIVLDTVRADHTSAYGYERETTPALARLAARGTRFERAYSSASWTIPAHGSLFTGLLPEEHGAHWEHMLLDAKVPTLAGLLAGQGFETAAFSASAFVSAGTLLTRGFQHVEEFWRPFVIQEGLTAWRLLRRVWPHDRDKGGGALVKGVRRWLGQRDPARPYFLFVNLFEAHAPYQAVPTRYRTLFTPPGTSLGELEVVGTLGNQSQWRGDPFPRAHDDVHRALMDGAVAAVDAYLAAILAEIGDDVVIFVLSDHGDLVGEHGLHGHGIGLYEPLIRIPLVMAGPGVPAGATVEAPVSILDLMPTILGMTGISRADLAGIDLREARSGRNSGERVIYAQQMQAFGLIARGWSRFHSREAIASLQARKAAAVAGTAKRVLCADGSDRGYDLATDPGEARPFAGSQLGIPVHVPNGRKPSGNGIAVDAGTAAALRALGYAP